MKIVFSKRLIRKELGAKPTEDDFLVIRKGYEKGIYESIKGESLPLGSRLIKVYATTVSGARRIVYLIDIESGDVFFLFFRTKNDRIGSNLTINNPEFKKKLQEYLAILFEDLENDNFQVMEIS
ncbi:MAG: hypothetical protein PHH70_03035 [Candidatus Gracilibacteria bacterium]|nr:hypothetical protein [Candidatus Gracilibacteria bacterium]